MDACRVIVTRPREQAQAWLPALRAAGFEALALPLIEIVPSPDAPGVQRAWAELAHMRLAMFVSAQAVRHFFGAAPGSGGWPPATWAGSTGPGTTAALHAAGVPAACIVEPPAGAQAESEGLWLALRDRDWRGARVLVVRGEQGRDWLADTLRAAGAQVGFVAAYARRAPRPDGAGCALLAAACAQPRDHAWIFSSAEAVQHLGQLAPGTHWGAGRAVATHPRIAQAARQAGFGRVELAQGAQVQPVLAALARLQSDPS